MSQKQEMMQSKSARNFEKKIQQSRKQKNTYDGNTLKRNNKNNVSMRTSAPIANPNIQKQKSASFSRSSGGMVVTHSEYIQDMIGSDVAFVVAKLAVNPGMSQTFPWLSTIATRFQKYRFRRLSFRYETSAPSTQQGYVMIVPDFDSSDQIPTTKQQALQYQSAIRSNVWEKISLFIRDKDLHAEEQYYIRSTTVPNTDIKTYDVAQLFTAMVGPAATLGPIGELWVDYEVELISPVIPQYSSLFQDLALQCTAVTNNVGFGGATVLYGNLAYSISGSYRLLNFGQYFRGLISIFGNQNGPGPWDANISGATTNATSISLVASMLSTNNWNYMAIYAIEINQGGYLAFDNWCPVGSTACTVTYIFTPDNF